MSQKLFLNTGVETIKGGALHALKDSGNAGAYDFANMPLTGVVVDQETFELGTDVYEINVVATDTGAESTVQIEIGDTSIIFDTQPTIPLLPGDVIRMESEFMIVIDYNVNGTGSANVVRGAFGTTEAQHTIVNSDTFQAAQPVVAGNFAVPTSAAAAATADDAIVGAVQFWSDGGYSKGLGGGIGVRVENGLKVDAFIADGTTTVGFAYPADGGVAATLATDMTNATITAFGGGVEPAGQVYSKIIHKATAGDVSAGVIQFVAPWDVDEAYTFVADSTGVQLAWDGTTTVAGTRQVTVTNAGATDWAAGDLLEVTILAA